MPPYRLAICVALLLGACASCPPCSERATSRACPEGELGPRATAGGDAPVDASTAEAAGPALRLCSWNVKKLGHGSSTDFPIVAAVLDDNCDVAVIVEVMQRQGGHPGYDALLAALSGWEGVVTDSQRPRTTSGSAEFYAVVWRSSSGVGVCEDWPGGLRFVRDSDGGPNGVGEDRFAREPAYVCLAHRSAAGTTVDFILAAYHATWAEGDTDVIAAEVAHIAIVAEEMGAARQGERDVFVLGDFNLVPDDLATALPGFADRTRGSGSTLNSHGEVTDNLYDHVLISDAAASTEVREDAVVLDVRDVVSTPEDFYRTVSDHLPIVIRVSTGGEDDD